MLPKITHRILRTSLPSTGQEIAFRPMQGREEKLLLTAKEAGEEREILTTVMQVVANCVLDPDFDVRRAPIFDVEWLFVQIRIHSVSPVSRVAYLDHADQQVREFDVDLEKIEVVRPDSADPLIKISEDVAVELRYPPCSAFVDVGVVSAPTDADAAHALAATCVDKVYDGDEVLLADDHSPDEVLEFVSQFDIETYQRLMEWVASVPTLRYVIKYANAKGEEREIALSNLTDFFKFR